MGPPNDIIIVLHFTFDQNSQSCYLTVSLLDFSDLELAEQFTSHALKTNYPNENSIIA